MEKLYIQNKKTDRGKEQVMNVQVKIVDSRTVFGREEVEITPALGSGSWWINKDKLIHLDPKLKAKIHV